MPGEMKSYKKEAFTMSKMSIQKTILTSKSMILLLEEAGGGGRKKNPSFKFGNKYAMSRMHKSITSMRFKNMYVLRWGGKWDKELLLRAFLICTYS